LADNRRGSVALRTSKDEDVGVNQPPRQTRGNARRMSELNKRLRLAFIAGAEERSRKTTGRGLTEAELERVLRRYPGDLRERYQP
jgi:hypothetical protein